MGDEYPNLEEGSPCPEQGCEGHMVEAPSRNCSCHINPPCSSCVEAGYLCDVCGFETNEYEEPEIERPLKVEDRTGQETHTYTANPFNSTPFTKCCGTAATDTNKCPSCNATIGWHDDGLATRRREVGHGNCLMCGKPTGDIAVSGNCHC